MARFHAAWFCLLILAASQQALGLSVSVGVSTDVPFAAPCAQLIDDAPASCSSVGVAGLAQAGGDPSFNGGVRSELYLDSGPLGSSQANLLFAQTLRNTRSQPEALLIRSVLLPGRVFVAGDAEAQLFVGMILITGGISVERIATMALMTGDANGNTTWQNVDPPALDSDWESARWAGVPSNWPQDGPVASDVTLPFSVLDFTFNRLIAPGEEFSILYRLSVFARPAPSPQFVEAVLVNVGDPLDLAQTPLIQYDQSVFAAVPEPSEGLLMWAAIAGLLGRSGYRIRRRRSSLRRPSDLEDCRGYRESMPL